MNSSLVQLLVSLFCLMRPGASVPYTADTGQCSGGLSLENEAGKVIHSTSSGSSCQDICTSDHTCTGYNVQSSDYSWCLTYYSKYMHVVTTSEYSSWTCYRKETDYDVFRNVCYKETGYDRQNYNDLNCESRCKNSDTCTGFRIGQIKYGTKSERLVHCSTYTTEGIGRSTRTPFLDTVYSCIVRKRMRYTFILSTGNVGTDVGNRMSLTVFGSKGRVTPDATLETSGTDLPRNSKTEYTWTMRDVGDVEKITVSTTSEGRWCPRYIAMVTDHDPIPALYRTKNSKDCTSTKSSLGKSTIEFFPASS